MHLLEQVRFSKINKELIKMLIHNSYSKLKVWKKKNKEFNTIRHLQNISKAKQIMEE
jgi:hypothetical protein